MALVSTHRPYSLVLFGVAVVAAVFGAVVLGVVALVAVVGMVIPISLPPLNVALGNLALIAVSSFAVADVVRPHRRATSVSLSSVRVEHGARVRALSCGL